MYYKSNNIMVYFTPNENGKLIMQHALFFRETLGMRIFICHIKKNTGLFGKFINFKKNHLIINFTQEKLKEFVRKIISSNDLEQFSFRIKTGRIIPILIRQSIKGGYEFMIVDKSNSSTSLKPKKLDKLISHSFCPVMAVNVNYPIKEIKKIVVPVDVTQSTKKKLLWATYFAKKYGAKIIIVSALTLNFDIKKSLAWKNSEKLKIMLSKRGIECDVKILNASGQEKHEVILDFIREENPDMVIIRTHQEPYLLNTGIGNFVSELVHNCKVPVFTVNSYITANPEVL
jgi:nucleotide-binding universal stress UspA family protein